MLAFYLLLTGCCLLKLQTSLINSIFIGCGRPNRWVGERDNSPKGILEKEGQHGGGRGNPIHALSSCVKVHPKSAVARTVYGARMAGGIQNRIPPSLRGEK